MQSLLVLTIVSCLAASASAFFLSPDIYNPPPANRTVCQSFAADSANVPTSANRIPYLSCANQGTLRINSCRLEVSNTTSCPLNYPGAAGTPGFPNSPRVIRPGIDTLINTDCTVQLTTLCNGQTDCSFEWRQLGNLQVMTVGVVGASNVDVRDQDAQVVFTCTDKRKQCEL